MISKRAYKQKKYRQLKKNLYKQRKNVQNKQRKLFIAGISLVQMYRTLKVIQVIEIHHLLAMKVQCLR